MDDRTMKRLVERADILKAIASPVRLFILERLEDEDLPVSLLAEGAGVSMPTLSRHLFRMKKAGILESRRRDNFVFYGLRNKGIMTVRANIEGVLVRETGRLKTLSRNENRKVGRDRRSGGTQGGR